MEPQTSVDIQRMKTGQNPQDLRPPRFPSVPAPPLLPERPFGLVTMMGNLRPNPSTIFPESVVTCSTLSPLLSHSTTRPRTTGPLYPHWFLFLLEPPLLTILLKRIPHLLRHNPTFVGFILSLLVLSTSGVVVDPREGELIFFGCPSPEVVRDSPMRSRKV